MPTRARVNDFIKEVVSGSHVAAIEQFYHADATMQENLGEPRRGRETLMKHEAAALRKVNSIKTHAPRHIIIDGDHVVIGWVFDMEGLDGVTRRLEELSLQTWRGDRILEEQFFYDSATAWTEVS